MESTNRFRKHFPRLGIESEFTAQPFIPTRNATPLSRQFAALLDMAVRRAKREDKYEEAVSLIPGDSVRWLGGSPIIRRRMVVTFGC